MHMLHIDDLVQDCSISSALALQAIDIKAPLNYMTKYRMDSGW